MASEICLPLHEGRGLSLLKQRLASESRSGETSSNFYYQHRSDCFTFFPSLIWKCKRNQCIVSIFKAYVSRIVNVKASMVGFAILGYPTYSITHDTFVNSKEIRMEVMYKISGRMEKTKYF